jgi:hypothetical protein
LLLAGAFAAGTGAAARMCFRWTAPTGVAFEWFVSFCLLAWGIAVSSIAAYADGLALFWTILAGEELWAWWSVTGLARRLRSFQAARGAMNDREPAPQTSEVPGASDALVGKHALSPQVVCEADVLQEFVRSRQPGGAEQLSGWMRVSLSPGQRTAVVHLAFCPPFARTPAVTVVQHEGPAARIKAVQVLPFGARMDLKLAQAPPSNADVLLEIAVHADGTEG